MIYDAKVNENYCINPLFLPCNSKNIISIIMSHILNMHTHTHAHAHTCTHTHTHTHSGVPDAIPVL